MSNPREPEGMAFDDASVERVITETVPNVIAVYRFGSTVKGVARSDSDVDLAILAREPLAAELRFDLQERLAAMLRRDVDLVDLRQASTVMRMQIVASGEVMAVFDRLEKDSFEAYVYSAYARLQEERAPILDRVRRERTVYGG